MSKKNYGNHEIALSPMSGSRHSITRKSPGEIMNNTIYLKGEEIKETSNSTISQQRMKDDVIPSQP